MPKVSIVLPTYNGQDYINDSIDSIRNQTFTDWELIIVNDCSTDHIPDIVSEYEKLDSRIRVINNIVNQKLPKSLNIGFRETKGEYLTWTSDDNMYLPTAIEKMVSYLDSNPKEYMVCTKMEYITEDNEFECISAPYSNEFMYYADCVGACFLYRREILQTVGEYDADLFLVEDYEYWLRILFKYKNIGFVDEVLYTYRKQGKSLTATRLNEIYYNNCKMRTKHIHKIAEGLKNRDDLLLQLYFEIEYYYGMTEPVEYVMNGYIGDILKNRQSELADEVIVYGAGRIGTKFYEKYGDKVKFFADRDKNKIGGKIEDVSILSLEQVYSKASEYQIVVAAGIEKIASFLLTLRQFGINGYFVYKDEWGRL